MIGVVSEVALFVILVIVVAMVTGTGDVVKTAYNSMPKTKVSI